MAEEWTIDKLVPGGAGFARRADGSAAFARGVAPGERIRVTTLREKKGYAEAQDFELLTRADVRVTPACAVADRCGGCDWLHLSYEAQLANKALLLEEALRRTAGLGDVPPIRVTASPRVIGYRQRVRLHIDDRGRVGFFQARSHSLIEVDHCPATRPELDRALAEFVAIAREHPRATAEFEQAELSVAPSPPERALFLWPRERGAGWRAPEGFLGALAPAFAVAVRGSSASFAQRFPLSDTVELEALPFAFVQVNREVNRALVNAVVTGALARGAARFLDLYAGAGNFSLMLAAAGLSGISVEAHPGAAASAERSLGRYGYETRVSVVTGDVRRALPKLGKRAQGADLAVLDPPRAGAAEILSALVVCAPRHVAYVSCDPVTLARDVRTLGELGYRLTSVEGFDMFPGTHHVEALAWLERVSRT